MIQIPSKAERSKFFVIFLAVLQALRSIGKMNIMKTSWLQNDWKRTKTMIKLWGLSLHRTIRNLLPLSRVIWHQFSNKYYKNFQSQCNTWAVGTCHPWRIAFSLLVCARSPLWFDRNFTPFFSHFQPLTFCNIFLVLARQREKSQKYFNLSAFN